MLTQEQKVQLVRTLNQTRQQFVDKTWDDTRNEELFTTLLAGSMTYEAFIFNILGLTQDEYNEISIKDGVVTQEEIDRMNKVEVLAESIVQYADRRTKETSGAATPS